MQDGYTQVGAGQNDMRQVGNDLQHHVQSRTADENLQPTRLVRSDRLAGGPMKEYMEEESRRHMEAGRHRASHVERHHSRGYDSQYGHDTYKY